MKRIILLLIVILSWPVDAYGSSEGDRVWSALDTGLSYRRLHINQGTDEHPRLTTIHAFRIDPRHYRFDMLIASRDKTYGESIARMAKRAGAIVAVNGGFFTPSHKSIGLVVQSHRTINPLHNTSWWSVFGIRNNKPSILPPWKAKHLSNYQMAVQAGPRLVVRGAIPRLKNNSPAARTAVGITRSGEVIMLATEGTRLTLHDLAEIMRTSRSKGGLECIDAMALDGGSSTQLYARAGKVRLSLEGFKTVPNGVGVFKKTR